MKENIFGELALELLLTFFSSRVVDWHWTWNRVKIIVAAFYYCIFCHGTYVVVEMMHHATTSEGKKIKKKKKSLLLTDISTVTSILSSSNSNDNHVISAQWQSSQCQVILDWRCRLSNSSIIIYAAEHGTHTFRYIFKIQTKQHEKKLLYTRSFNTDNKQAGNSPFPMISSKICLNNFY